MKSASVFHCANKGFTLLEILVGVLILGVILMIGIPNFTSLFENSRGRSAVLDLSNAFAMGREAAMKERQRVTLCRADANFSGCAAGTDWSGGWVLCIGDNSIDTLLKAWQPSSANSATVTASSANNFVFSPIGEVTTGQFVVDAGDYDRCVTVTMMGQTYSQEPNDDGTCP